MAADAEGNDLGAVGVPITGFAAVQLDGDPAYIESADGAVTPLALPDGYVKAGLFTSDGGPQDGSDDDDEIEFFQQGYTISGDSKLNVQIKLAEFNAIVQRLTTGKTPDANGMIVVDTDTPDAQFPLFIVTKYKNGFERRRNGLARVSAVSPDQETRGSVSGKQVTFDWVWQDDFAPDGSGGFYREWIISPTAAAPPAEQQPAA